MYLSLVSCRAPSQVTYRCMHKNGEVQAQCKLSPAAASHAHALRQCTNKLFFNYPNQQKEKDCEEPRYVKMQALEFQ